MKKANTTVTEICNIVGKPMSKYYIRSGVIEIKQGEHIVQISIPPMTMILVLTSKNPITKYSPVNYHNKSFDDLIDLGYETTVAETKVSPLNKKDLRAAHNTAKENRSRWKDINIQLCNHIDNFKKESYIFYIIITIFIQCFFAPWFANEVGIPIMSKIASSIKEFPEKGAEIICHLEQNIKSIITENQNYYKVSFIDENGIEHEGYVAKRNLKLINTKDSSEEKTSVSENDINYDD